MQKVLTVQVVQDFVNVLVLSNLLNDISDAVCIQTISGSGIREVIPRHLLNKTPIKVNITNCEITKNAK